jgi:hypothetical protein
MASLYNRARVTTSTTGTGTVTLGAAFAGYFTFAEAGVQDADVVAYTIEDGNDFEIGTGTYTASGTTLTRTVTASKIGGVAGTSAINLSGSATVFITARAEDIGDVFKDGISGGQTIIGGTDSGDDLVLSSTSNATKGTIRLGDATTGLFFDEVDERLSLGGAGNTFTFAGIGPVGIDIAIHNDEGGEVCQGVFRYSDTAGDSACWIGLRSRGTMASPTVVQNNDRLASLSFFGYDGTDYEFGGYILVEVDGTPGNNDMPGRMIFATTPDGSQTPAEAMRINSDQSVQFSTVARPDANDGAALGSATVSWSDLFLASGGLINWANSNYTITHSSGLLTFSGGITATAGTVTLGVVAGAIDAGGATSLEIPNDTAPTVNADGEIAVDTSVTDFSHGILKYYGGEEMAVIAVPIGELTSPSDGDVVAYNATNDEFELVPQSGGSGITPDTVQATTSGTAFDFTSLPAGLNRITIIFDNVSVNGSDAIIVQVGDSGGVETTGYESAGARLASSATTQSSAVNGFNISTSNSAHAFSGSMIICRITGNIWVASHSGGNITSAVEAYCGGGRKALSAELDRVRVTRGGSNAFDSGQVNIFYE